MVPNYFLCPCKCPQFHLRRSWPNIFLMGTATTVACILIYNLDGLQLAGFVWAQILLLHTHSLSQDSIVAYASIGSLQLGLSNRNLIFTMWKNKNSRTEPRLIEFRSMKNFKLPDCLANLKGPHGLQPTHSTMPMMNGFIGKHFSKMFLKSTRP